MGFIAIVSDAKTCNHRSKTLMGNKLIKAVYKQRSRPYLNMTQVFASRKTCMHGQQVLINLQLVCKLVTAFAFTCVFTFIWNWFIKIHVFFLRIKKKKIHVVKRSMLIYSNRKPWVEDYLKQVRRILETLETQILQTKEISWNCLSKLTPKPPINYFLL